MLELVSFMLKATKPFMTIDQHREIDPLNKDHMKLAEIDIAVSRALFEEKLARLKIGPRAFMGILVIGTDFESVLKLADIPMAPGSEAVAKQYQTSSIPKGAIPLVCLGGWFWDPSLNNDKGEMVLVHDAIMEEKHPAHNTVQEIVNLVGGQVVLRSGVESVSDTTEANDLINKVMQENKNG